MELIPLLIISILLLIVLNGVFSGMEIALVSVPRARLKRYEKEQRPGAATAIELQKDIDGFFAVVQIGVTFIGTLSSAIGGSAAIEIFNPVIKLLGIPADSTAAHIVAVLGVSITISFFSLVIGELVPKSLARRNPGKISLFLAGPFKYFSAILKPGVWLLTGVTRLILRVFGIKGPSTTSGLTTEEFRMMASELVESRQMPIDIHNMIVRVTRLSQIRVEDVMIPRYKIVSVKVESKQDPNLRDRLLRTYRKHHYSSYPIIDRIGENILGVVNIKDLLMYDDTRSVVQLLRPPTFTARGQTLDRVLASMQKNDEQLSVVVDEHGMIDGIITLEDLLEEFVGEAGGVEPPTFTTGDPVPQEEGSIVVDGLITLHELNELHSITLPHSFYYSTLAGFVLDKLGSIPQVGDHLDHEGLRFTVMEMDRNRIKLLKISKLQSE